MKEELSIGNDRSVKTENLCSNKSIKMMLVISSCKAMFNNKYMKQKKKKLRRIDTKVPIRLKTRT